MLLSSPLSHVNGDVAGVLEGVTGKLDDAQLKELASALAQSGDTGLADLATQVDRYRPTRGGNAINAITPHLHRSKRLTSSCI